LWISQLAACLLLKKTHRKKKLLCAQVQSCFAEISEKTYRIGERAQGMVSLFRFHIKKIVENSRIEEKATNEEKGNVLKLACVFYLFSTGVTISFCPG